MLTKASLSSIKAYQLYIKGYLPATCRFSPSCSEYTRQAIEKYGFLRGSFKGAWRTLSCHPFSGKSGYNPLE